MRRFDFHEPASTDDAIALLSRLGAPASVLAGGTDLLVEIKEQLRRPDHIVDIKRIPGINGLAFDPADGLRFGALATAREIETSPAVRRHYAGLWQATRELGSIQIRNRATVVGNICRGSPSADTIPPLIADGASLDIVGPTGTRTVMLEAFFTGPGRTVLTPAEIVTGVVVPPPARGTGKAYIKHGRRKAMELATVGVAVTLTLDGATCREIRIALGAVAPTVIRAMAAEAKLRGGPLGEGEIAAAGRMAAGECRPISNVRGSADYRRQMVDVLTQRAITLAKRQAEGAAA
jgi:carbon-monoxide dehydrogenase medium subunit